MSRKNINFEDTKINKNNFYKSKKILSIYDLDVNKYWFLKKNHMVQKIHLNTLLDIMMYKTSSNGCLLRLVITNF